jgi:hypothetical protein
MNDLVDFKYINNSLTTLVQHRFISKLSRYFGLSTKLMRAHLDEESIKERGVISFHFPEAIDIREEFYIASFKLNVHELINPDKFDNSRLNREYITMVTGQYRQDATMVVYDRDFFVLFDMDFIDFGSEGGGGIYVNYYPEFRHKILLPLAAFLKLRYPLPHL